MGLTVPAPCLSTASTPVAASSRDGVLGENGVTLEEDGVEDDLNPRVLVENCIPLTWTSFIHRTSSVYKGILAYSPAARLKF